MEIEVAERTEDDDRSKDMIETIHEMLNDGWKIEWIDRGGAPNYSWWGLFVRAKP